VKVIITITANKAVDGYFELVMGYLSLSGTFRSWSACKSLDSTSITVFLDALPPPIGSLGTHDFLFCPDEGAD